MPPPFLEHEQLLQLLEMAPISLTPHTLCKYSDIPQ